MILDMFTVSLLLGGLFFTDTYKRYHKFGQNLHTLEIFTIVNANKSP